ncbi:hypothetical protein KUCAC02_030230 [Chaenocephalus aceratus]|uniref:Uncharacterized protein n=1 Tax=Chaenocephalus aceratus TaxID=36190 RepID=A0ACB9XK82_CHAAC|nr:hypothetical protein KUCAC02_030230 [Chaenocephalus aceratus]
MEDDASRSAPTAQSAAPEESTSWAFGLVPTQLASCRRCPSSEIKPGSSRWKDRQCTIWPGALCVTRDCHE